MERPLLSLGDEDVGSEDVGDEDVGRRPIVIMELFTPYVHGLGNALGLHQQRHQIISENVANAETPGYRARDLDFGTALSDAFDGTNASAEATVDRQAKVKLDGNSVDLHTEMARLSDNTLRLMALTRFISGSYAGLKSAISGNS